MDINLKYLHSLILSMITASIIMNPSDLQANTAGAASGALGDRTGSPLSSATCSQCHSGGSFGSVGAVISVTDNNGPVTTFVSGITYTITIEVTNTGDIPSGYGFQATVLDTSNAFIGVFSNPSPGTTIAFSAGRQYWEQSTTSASNIFTIDWTPPAEMTMVTIYAVGLGANGNGGTSGDLTSTSTSFAASLPVELMNFSVD